MYLLDCFIEYNLFLCCTMCLYLMCHILWPEVSVINYRDDGHMRATALCIVCVFAHARPIMFYIHLVKINMHVTFHPLGGCMNAAPMQDRAGYEWVTSYKTEPGIAMENEFRLSIAGSTGPVYIF